MRYTQCLALDSRHQRKETLSFRRGSLYFFVKSYFAVLYFTCVASPFLKVIVKV
jgi:hypothetical protein